MSQGATSGGDLRNTGMSSKHDRERDYEPEQIVEVIEEHDARRVDLQFPKGLRRRDLAVVDDLRQFYDNDVTSALSGQPCYGACSPDIYLMHRTNVFVHLSHSPMKRSDRITYAPLFPNADPFPIAEDALSDTEDNRVGLVTTAQYMNRFENMCDRLKERGCTVQTHKSDDRLTYEGQALGCNYTSANTPTDDVLYVDGGKFYPLGLVMEYPNRNVVIADPVNNVVIIMDMWESVKQCHALVYKAMDIEKRGVIFCTKIGQSRMEIIGKILEDNENACLITMDEVTPDRLRNFDMDAFVNAGCPRVTADGGPWFHKPMLTLREYRITVSDGPLDALEFDTFRGA